MKRKSKFARHVLSEDEERKPLTRRAVLLRLREVYEIIDLKKAVHLTAADVEIIDYNFALAQLYDKISARGEVHAIGFEADIGGEEYYEEEDKKQ